METVLTKNTLVVFMYRDGSNYKTWSESEFYKLAIEL